MSQVRPLRAPGALGLVDGKSANGLVRHSDKYDVLSVIDSMKSGLDAREVVGRQSQGVPVCSDPAHAKATKGRLVEMVLAALPRLDPTQRIGV